MGLGPRPPPKYGVGIVEWNLYGVDLYSVWSGAVMW